MSELPNGSASNLFRGLEKASAKEMVQILSETPHVRIERIVSHGQSSPDDFWYDQSENEWVAVLAGNGVLELQDPDEVIQLNVGDFLLIPAHRRHRVQSTAEDVPTVWLAIFFAL